MPPPHKPSTTRGWDITLRVPLEMPPSDTLNRTQRCWFHAVSKPSQALVGAPGASATRIESLWPAVVGLLDGLEAVAASGPGDDPAVARETCIESLLAASR